MLDQRPQPHRPRRSEHPPFPRILCAVDRYDAARTAIEQAIALAGGGARIVFAAQWYGKGSLERAAEADEHAHDAAERAVEQAHEAGVEARAEYFHSSRLSDALLSQSAWHDVVVVGAHPHSRATGIVLGETATVLAHRCAIPVLVARRRPLAAGVVTATRAVPADRAVLTAAIHIAARVGAELTVVHVAERGDERRQSELKAELANARALFGRPLDNLEVEGPAARAIVDVAEGDGAGLVVVGSEGRQGLPALRSVSERVAHSAPCSVLVVRER
jgi:nucleotide-binding universal stress UspA family protein